jgi:hypothetical protein
VRSPLVAAKKVRDLHSKAAVTCNGTRTSCIPRHATPRKCLTASLPVRCKISTKNCTIFGPLPKLCAQGIGENLEPNAERKCFCPQRENLILRHVKDISGQTGDQFNCGFVYAHITSAWYAACSTAPAISQSEVRHPYPRIRSCFCSFNGAYLWRQHLVAR